MNRSMSLNSQALVPSRLLYAVWNYADYMAGYAQVASLSPF